MFKQKKIASLNQRLWTIGFRIGYTDDDIELAAEEKLVSDIEKTIIDAAYEAKNDFRLLSILMTWIKIHGDKIIVEKFFKLVKAEEKIRGHNSILNGIAVWSTICGHARWQRYISHEAQDEFLVDQELAENAIQFQGAKSDWLQFGVKVPLKMIRIRDDDVFTVSELVKANEQYRNRFIFGTSWRADIIYAIELGIKTPAKIVKLLGCSYEPAHRIFNEYRMANSILRAF